MVTARNRALKASHKRKTLRCNVTNEGGYGGKASFLKNIIGLWLIQETRRQWQKEGDSLSFAEMETLARNAKPFSCFIDPDAPDFVAAGNIPERIRAYCRRTGQYVPESKGEILRCIYESLAMKYRYAAEQIEFCTGKEYDTIYIVGGGTKDKLLSSFTASACNKMFPPDLPRPPFSAILLFSFWRRAK